MGQIQKKTRRVNQNHAASLEKYSNCKKIAPVQSDHGAGLRTHRWFLSSSSSSSESTPLSLAAMLASTFLSFRIPGIIVETAGLLKINLRAISAIEEFSGTSGFKASARSTLGIRFSGVK